MEYSIILVSTIHSICTFIYIVMCFIYLSFGVNSHGLPKLLLKCAPLAILIAQVMFSLAYVASESMNAEKSQEDGHAAENDDVIRHMKILIWGLVFSCIGDGCLVFPRIFQFGLLSFAVAQCVYIHLFGLNLDLLYNLPLQGLFSAVGVALLSGTIMVGFWIQLKSHMRNLSLKLPIVTGVVVYFILVSTMLWSAVLRLQLNGDWASGLGVVGAILFYISDLLIAVCAVWKLRPMLLQGRALIMAMYYGAQLIISMSVILGRFK